MNADTAAQVQWLVDRARISDVLLEFARTLDERDWAANTALYVPEGVFTAGDTLRLQGHDQLLRTGHPRAWAATAARGGSATDEGVER